MKNKRSNRLRKFNARIILCIIMFTMLISTLFSTPGIAEGNVGDVSIESAMRSDFFLKIIGSTVSALKPEKNSDDTNFIGKFSVNALNIVNNELSFLKSSSNELNNAANSNKEDVFNNIVINPFKINDGTITKVDEQVDILGDPSDNSKKKILIYHTHTNEAYAEGNTGLESTVCAVGDVLTEELESLGFTVIHDKTIHDVVDYNNAYYASRETLSKYLNTYGDFDLIIDLHRDAVNNKEAVTGSIDGNSIAKLMFVEAELNPRYAAQSQIIESMVSIANEMYPGLFRTKYLYTYPKGIIYYSQDLSDNLLLLEVGANSNNLQEAKNSMLYMSKVIAAYLNKK